MTPLPLAHPTHWLASLLYLAPVFVLAGGIFWQRRADKRARLERESGSGDQPAD